MKGFSQKTNSKLANVMDSAESGSGFSQTNSEIKIKSPKSKKRKGPGLRDVSITENPNRNKWRVIRWTFLLSVNFMFFASFYFDIQILEGSLSGSRLLGFHLADPFAAIQVMLASRVFNINLIIGVTTIVIVYLLIGGRFFCSWVCPYHFLAELGEMTHKQLIQKKIIKRNHVFNGNLKYYFFALFLVLSLLSGYTIFEVINPVSILSRSFVYGVGLIIFWVLALLLFEIFYSRRAWCRYFCPVGVPYNIIGRVAPFKVHWNISKCSNCKKCQRACMVPWVLKNTVNMGAADYIVSGDCTRCGLCLDACEDGALSYNIRYLDKLI
ncbi:MAG: NapH/MauN family ferredoxin-type protein [SAR324 cluster bacterium]|nr:NapH/MauN family ferredoxin-type protein [SAR324 cluster bacterium]MBL7035665.1 NapH/MauN family ferredoxin-type protein [SAR324 cluster bacterium]